MNKKIIEQINMKLIQIFSNNLLKQGVISKVNTILKINLLENFLKNLMFLQLNKMIL